MCWFTRNKYVLQADLPLFRWAVKKGYLQRLPIDDDTITWEKCMTKSASDPDA